ncbi:2OG-Fe(II) oxygenase family oxidoreductase [Xylogone sp. PMI_703]|nr:2OG-Fe(II) oxygenase family oxidoreductase [Xylogone sp. PMI_703]
MELRTKYSILLVPISILILSVLRYWQPISEYSSTILGLTPFGEANLGHFDPVSYSCVHSYTIELLSIDPLVIYINNFLTDAEIEHLLDLGKTRYNKSAIGGGLNQTVRRSQTAMLPKMDIVCTCLTQRMKALLGNIQHFEVEVLQIVKYETGGDQFKYHMDWFDAPKNDSSYGHNGLTFKPSNRLGTIFAYLDDNCTQGETYFPNLPSVAETADGDKFAIPDGDTGLLVKPRRGNAVFWNNLHPNGSGDTRVGHQGLPVESGTKIGLNMWSRYFFDRPMVGAD